MNPLKFFKKMISVGREVNADQNRVKVVNPKTEKVISALEAARAEIHEKRKRGWEEKARDLAGEYTVRLNQFLNEYFRHFSEDEDENNISYDTLNKAWMAYAVNANRIQKKVSVDPKAFEMNVGRIISSPKFKEELEKTRQKNKENHGETSPI